MFCALAVTCSGLSPGGTQAYSSEAQPESSSEMECLWKSETSFVIIFSSWPGTERTACSSRPHLQCTQIFLWTQGEFCTSCLRMLGLIRAQAFTSSQNKAQVGPAGALSSQRQAGVSEPASRLKVCVSLSLPVRLCQT